MEADQTVDITTPFLNSSNHNNEAPFTNCQAPRFPKQENTFGLPTKLKGKEPETFYCNECQEVQISDINKKCTLASVCKASSLTIMTIPCLILGKKYVHSQNFYGTIHICPQCRKEVGRG